eukprot:gnl/TRDRNA2_/TRDRNA2_152860_c2_seq10.p1 gnl/TRDRNA2_/TRDRNA2_152860_c2~~gnl/TRDRNA2_/TRDRNA2_152860_c2_seq10.p1  ORF type:complete len:376 (-),score=66.18 gnl/TRDRNA2_/TRDRNA2_152860_c2_seq10:138-1265(-)
MRVYDVVACLLPLLASCTLGVEHISSRADVTALIQQQATLTRASFAAEPSIQEPARDQKGHDSSLIETACTRDDEIESPVQPMGAGAGFQFHTLSPAQQQELTKWFIHEVNIIPELKKKVESDTDLKNYMNDIAANPMAGAKYMFDPKIGPFIFEVFSTGSQKHGLPKGLPQLPGMTVATLQKDSVGTAPFPKLTAEQEKALGEWFVNQVKSTPENFHIKVDNNPDVATNDTAVNLGAAPIDHKPVPFSIPLPGGGHINGHYPIGQSPIEKAAALGYKTYTETEKKEPPEPEAEKKEPTSSPPDLFIEPNPYEQKEEYNYTRKPFLEDNWWLHGKCGGTEDNATKDNATKHSAAPSKSRLALLAVAAVVVGAELR